MSNFPLNILSVGEKVERCRVLKAAMKKFYVLNPEELWNSCNVF
jgi:hypothetical protein